MTVCAALVVFIGLAPKGILNISLRAGQSIQEPTANNAAAAAVESSSRQVAADP